jgi:hypothetical protein
MQRTITMVLGAVMAAAVAIGAALAGPGEPPAAEAPPTGGNTPLAPYGVEEDPGQPVLFVEGEPVYDLSSVPVYDLEGNEIDPTAP